MNIDKEREAFEKALEQSQGFEFKYLIGITFNNGLNKYEVSGTHWCDEVEEACKEINIGWTSWQLAKSHESEKLEGCVVVPVEPTDEWMANYINSGVENYCEQFVGQKFAVTEQEKPSIKEEWRGPVRKAHALVLKVVEAARGGK